MQFPFPLFKAAFALFFLVGAQFPARADFGVGPMEVALQAPRPGAKVTSQFELFNSSDQPVHISTYAVDWNTDKSGSMELSEAGTSPASCAKWIQINPAQFILQPKKAVKVRYSIDTPTDLGDERRALVFFQSRPVPLQGQNKMQFAISTRVGCKVFVLPSSPLPRTASVAPLQLEEKPAPQTSNIVATFSNTGGQSLRVSGTVEALDEGGKVVGRGKMMPSNVQVLPRTEQQMRPEWDKPLAPGRYRFRAVLDYGDKKLIGVQGDFSPTESLGVMPSLPAPPVPATDEIPDAVPDPDALPGSAPDAPLPLTGESLAPVPQSVSTGEQP